MRLPRRFPTWAANPWVLLRPENAGMRWPAGRAAGAAAWPLRPATRATPVLQEAAAAWVVAMMDAERPGQGAGARLTLEPSLAT